MHNIYVLTYQCQSCLSEPITFLIKYFNNKITICGRSQFEKVKNPKYIPDQEESYYSNAIIAFNAGRTLAALYYLRAFVEHYLRRILNKWTKVTGEDLANEYSKLLPNDFPKRFTSLKKVYEELSVKLHSFDEDKKQFSKSLEDIKKHFRLLIEYPTISTKSHG